MLDLVRALILDLDSQRQLVSAGGNLTINQFKLDKFSVLLWAWGFSLFCIKSFQLFWVHYFSVEVL